MAAIPGAIRAFFKQSVTFNIKTTVGEDGYGKPVTAATTQLCRVDYSEAKFTTLSGEEMISHAQIYTDDIPTMTGDGTVTLPNGNVEKILSIKRNLWPNGAYSLEVYI